LHRDSLTPDIRIKLVNAGGTVKRIIQYIVKKENRSPKCGVMTVKKRVENDFYKTVQDRRARLQNSFSNKGFVQDSSEHIKAFSGAGANARIFQAWALNDNKRTAGIYTGVFFFLYAALIARFL